MEYKKTRMVVRQNVWFEFDNNRVASRLETGALLSYARLLGCITSAQEERQDIHCL